MIKVEFKQERLFRGAAKIHISKTSNVVVGIDFEGYGYGETAPHMRDTFSRYSVIIFIRNKKSKGQTADKVANDVLTNWICFLLGRRILF